MTLTKADIVDYLLHQQALDRSQSKLLVDHFFEIIRVKLEEGYEVKISGFGNFKIRKKKARPGRNPKTGKAATVCARQVVTFHVGEKLKSQIELLDPGIVDLTAESYGDT